MTDKQPVELLEKNKHLLQTIKKNHAEVIKMVSTGGKYIPGTDNAYKISRCGVILDCKNNKLVTLTNMAGYRIARIKISGSMKTARVHRLVLLTYIGPSNLHVNHKNGIRCDNRLENLEYCTSRENFLHSQHVLGRGPNPYGKSNRRLLDDIQVLTIFTMKNMTRTQIARHYGVSPSKINEIVSGFTYRELHQFSVQGKYKEGRGKHMRSDISYVINSK